MAELEKRRTAADDVNVPAGRHEQGAGSGPPAGGLTVDTGAGPAVAPAGLEERLTASVRAAVEGAYPVPGREGRFSYLVTEEDPGATVRQILKRRLKFSGRLLAKLKRGEGTVTRNGVEVRLFADVIPGDLVEVSLPEDRSHFTPQDIPVEVLYEDEDMLIVNKQPGLVVHPTRSHPDDTLANGLMKRMLDSGDSYKIRFVNRIDRDTSGLVVVARNSHCQDTMTGMMRRNEVEKRYVAIVHGVFSEEKGTVDLPLGRLAEGDVRRAVVPDGSPSVTHYRVLERFPSGFSLLELKLETGRTHQIRVHMAHIGHPIVGDTLYGREEPELIGRQALHAAQLRFRHPVGGQLLDVKAPLPEDMRELTGKIRRTRTAVSPAAGR